jgi:hypothetical protein
VEVLSPAKTPERSLVAPRAGHTAGVSVFKDPTATRLGAPARAWYTPDAPGWSFTGQVVLVHDHRG